MIDLAAYGQGDPARGGEEYKSLCSSAATYPAGQTQGTLDLRDFYVMMINHAVSERKVSAHDANSATEVLNKFVDWKLPMRPHISLERSSRGFPEPYVETWDQSGVYRMRKPAIMGLLSTMSPIWQQAKQRGSTSGPAGTNMEYLEKNYPAWDFDQWKYNLPSMSTLKKGWTPTSELITHPY